MFKGDPWDHEFMTYKFYAHYSFSGVNCKAKEKHQEA